MNVHLQTGPGDAPLIVPLQEIKQSEKMDALTQDDAGGADGGAEP
jgi:hypothetical protein